MDLLVRLELLKPRMVALILGATAAGYYLGVRQEVSGPLLAHLLGWTALVAGGTLALNQVLEREEDARMDRTRNRPIPSGRISPAAALVEGVLLVAVGLMGLALGVNPLCAAVTAAITASYLFLYTPLKQSTAFCTLWGGIPGALPPVAGWAAARGGLDFPAWVLFGILYLWQLPHALAIALRYREDYARGGMRLLPALDPTGAWVGRQAVLNCLALLGVGLLPTLIGMAGRVYFASALVLGLGFLGFAAAMAVLRTEASARRLEIFSLAYLPALLAVLALDKGGS